MIPASQIHEWSLNYRGLREKFPVNLVTPNSVFTHNSVFWAGLHWVVPLSLGFLGGCRHEQTQQLELHDPGLLTAGLTGTPGHWLVPPLSNWFFQWGS